MTMRDLPCGAAMLASLAALALAGCGEIPQDAAKPFAGKEETRSYAGGLADRAKTQDEYRVTGDAKRDPALAAK